MVLVLSIKNVTINIKKSIFRRNIRDTEKMLKNKIVDFKEIYICSQVRFLIGVIYFVYQ